MPAINVEPSLLGNVLLGINQAASETVLVLTMVCSIILIDIHQSYLLVL